MYPSSVAKLKGWSPNGTAKAIIQLDAQVSSPFQANGKQIANHITFSASPLLLLGYATLTYEKRTRMMISFVSYHLLSDWAMYRNGRKWNPIAALETAIAVLAGASLIWDRYM
jgi:hypothetical protein